MSSREAALGGNFSIIGWEKFLVSAANTSGAAPQGQRRQLQARYQWRTGPVSRWTKPSCG